MPTLLARPADDSGERTTSIHATTTIDLPIFLTDTGYLNSTFRKARDFRNWQMLSKKSKIERLRKSREDQFFVVSAAASLCTACTKVCDRSCVIRCGPSRCLAWEAPAALKNFVRQLFRQHRHISEVALGLFDVRLWLQSRLRKTPETETNLTQTNVLREKSHFQFRRTLGGLVVVVASICFVMYSGGKIGGSSGPAYQG
jgi:hypothetical protein